MSRWRHGRGNATFDIFRADDSRPCRYLRSPLAISHVTKTWMRWCLHLDVDACLLHSVHVTRMGQSTAAAGCMYALARTAR